MKHFSKRLAIGLTLITIALASAGCATVQAAVDEKVARWVSGDKTGVTVPPLDDGTVDTPAAPAAAVPAQPVAAATTGLKYDETGCDTANLTVCRSSGQNQFPAVYLRNVQSGDKTVVQAIVLIQQMAAAAGAPTWDKWSEHVADPISATLVWCPAGNCTYPPDSAFPLLNIGNPTDDNKVAIVSAHLPGDPSASKTQVKCPQGDCWAVLLR